VTATVARGGSDGGDGDLPSYQSVVNVNAGQEEGN